MFIYRTTLTEKIIKCTQLGEYGFQAIPKKVNKQNDMSWMCKRSK